MKEEIEQSEAEYIPFGEEWMKEMKKFNKEQLLNMYRSVCIELQKQREQFINNIFR